MIRLYSLVRFGDWNSICGLNWWLFFCRGLGENNRILVLNISTFSLNGHLFHLGVGKGFLLLKKKEEWAYFDAILRRGQRMRLGAFGSTWSSFCAVLWRWCRVTNHLHLPGSPQLPCPALKTQHPGNTLVLGESEEGSITLKVWGVHVCSLCNNLRTWFLYFCMELLKLSLRYQILPGGLAKRRFWLNRPGWDPGILHLYKLPGGAKAAHPGMYVTSF